MIVAVIISLAFALGYFLLLSTYADLWNQLEPGKEEIAENTSVSVIVPYRNEADNLPYLIHSINNLEIEAIEIEFIFINDHSTDEGEKVINESNIGPSFSAFSLSNGSGKKEALQLGWAKAKGTYIFQTDADCILPTNWVKSMLSCFASEVDLVSGPVKFKDEKGFFKHLVQLDFMGLIAIGASHIQWKKPMICNGANLAYRKSVISNAELNKEKASGDDVFLMQSVAEYGAERVAFCKAQGAMIETDGPQNFKEFWNQRLRWSSKNSNYSNAQNTNILGFVWLFNVAILIGLLSFSLIGLTVAATLVVFKIIAEDKYYSQFVEFFSGRNWFTNLFLGQLFHIVYMAVLPPLSQVLKYRWKERKLK
jgi:cellulose synthase/poly-beta-1,6-N-acetylglucosamine synthase-like glycosyltransferase